MKKRSAHLADEVVLADEVELISVPLVILRNERFVMHDRGYVKELGAAVKMKRAQLLGKLRSFMS